MHIVRGDQPEAQVFRDLRQHPVALVLFFHPVVVQFDEEILRAQNVAIFGRCLLCLLDVVRLECRIDFTRETPAEPDQTFLVLLQELLVDPGPVMKSIEMRSRD
jgi:hypothetical protein